MSEFVVTCDEEVASWVGNDVDSMKPLVRCRDCKYYNDSDEGCNLFVLAENKLLHVKTPDGFCAWGERENEEAKLKPCLFCKSETRLMAQHFTDDSHIYWVRCCRCGMEGPHIHDARPAIAAWNKIAEKGGRK